MAAGRIEGSGSEPWTVARVLSWASEDFKKRGIDSARLDAELLLAHTLGIDRVRLIIDARRPLEPDELASYRELIRRRREREPVAYLLGEREFYGLPMRVRPGVLIPRPDTETLVEVALDRTRGSDMYGRLLDLCTGSGCVLLAFHKHRPTWQVTGVDVSDQALAVARENATRLGLLHNCRLLLGDGFEPLRSGERFELITANPPYVSEKDMQELDPGISRYEPHLALFGGADGLDLIRRIIREAPERLVTGGVLALEVGYDQADRVAAALAERGFADIDRRRDYGGHQRVISGSWPDAAQDPAP